MQLEIICDSPPIITNGKNGKKRRRNDNLKGAISKMRFSISPA